MATWTNLRAYTPEAMTTAERDAEFDSPPSYLTIFNTTIGMYQVYTGERWVSIPQYVTVAATTAPGVGDDADDFYVIGDRWLDVTNDEEYVCLDVTVGAAVWKRTTLDNAAAESISGLWNFIASGLGGLTDYDLTIGDVATPDYGLIQFGDSSFGRTSYNAAGLDLDGAVISRNIGGPVTGQIEFVWVESAGPSVIRFALPKAGVGNATYNPRSMFLAGPAVNDDDIVTVGYWQGVGIFHNLVCDTDGDGADLGVQNDLEVEGDIFADSFKESTPGAGLSFANDIQGSFIKMLNVGAAMVQATPPATPADGQIWLDTSTSGTGTESLALVTKTGAYTATDSDTVILCDAAAAAFTITLPTAVGRTGKVFYVKKIDATANPVTIDGDGAETIDGALTQVIATQYNAIKIISDGSEWHIL